MINQGTPYYAAFLNLVGKLCIVIGGGRVAERKIKKLLESEADILVVSPEVSQQIAIWAHDGRIRHIQRAYAPGDLKGAFLVFAATNSRNINQLIYEEASRFGKLVNIVDSPESCSFIVPATVKHRNLQIAISTSGENPAEAKRLRVQLEHDIRHQTSTFIDEISNL